MALALQVGMEDFYEDRVVVRRGPRPGVAAVLSVIVPGLGQVYNGQLGAGLLWFLVTSFGYWAILVPGFLFHVLSVYFAFQSAKDWRRY